MTAHGVAPHDPTDTDVAAHTPLLPPDGAGAAAHACGICCPGRACKGLRVHSTSRVFRRLVFAGGDSTEDICAALALRPCDVALLRANGAAHCALAARRVAAGAASPSARSAAPALPSCAVVLWRDEDQLAELLAVYALHRSCESRATYAARTAQLAAAGAAWETGAAASDAERGTAVVDAAFPRSVVAFSASADGRPTSAPGSGRGAMDALAQHNARSARSASSTVTRADVACGAARTRAAVAAQPA
jgi:Putative Phosphatase